MATINGTAGNDTLVGTTSTDTISGLGGNDRLQGSGGNDSVLGGTGNDIVRGNDGTDWVEGGAGNDNVGGGGGQDSFVFREAGSTNADVFNDYSSGWDDLQLDAAFFTTLGAAGQFTSGDARFWSSSTGTAHDADDRIVYNTSTRQLWYDADGNGAGAAQLIGTLNSGATIAASDIWVFGTPPGGGSDQTINGTSGNDSLVGGAGNDTINGLAGNDTLVGLGGDDSLIGGGGFDSMDGGLGNDTYVTDGGDSVTDAGGIDTLILEGGGGMLQPGSGIENLTIRGYTAGEAGADGNELNNVIRDEGPGTTWIDGQGGNDTLIGSAGTQFFSFSGNYMPGVGYDEDYGHDVVDGGGDNSDWLFFENNSGAVTVDFRAGTVTGGSTVPASVSFTNVERAVGTLLGDVMFASDGGNDLWGYGGDDTMTGGAGADQLIGDSGLDHPTSSFGNDRLLGGGGNDGIAGEEGDDWMDGGTGDDFLWGGDNADSITGGEGNDWVGGEGGNDSLSGAAGADSFAFTVAAGATNADLIADFVSADDEIVLDGSVHANPGPTGAFAAGDARFWSSGTGTAHDVDDRVIYNTSNGQLWYDADGNGSGAAQLIATLQGAPSVVATDISIINGVGSGGGTTINGTSGDDSLVGGAGNDTISGFEGEDTIDGGGGADSMVGGAHADTYFVDHAGDVIVELEDGGFDIVNASVSYTLAAWVNHLTLTGSADSQGHGNELPNVIQGNAGHNFIFGFAGDDHLSGGDGQDQFDSAAGSGEGNDTLVGGAGRDSFRVAADGRDSIDGGSDFDSVSMDFDLTEVIVDLQAGIISAGGLVIADVLAVERVFATRFADQLTGDGFANNLFGFEGTDTLDGRGGNDTLGGGGHEDLHRFSVAPGLANADLVFGFASSFDTIQLDGTVHTNSGPSGTFAAGDARFWSSTSGAAHDADDRVIYNTSNGQLWYDADGTGSGAAQLIATFLTGSGGIPSSLAATDISIINGGTGGGGSTITGTSGDDSLVGGPGNDTLEGLAGDDTLDGLAGADLLDGGLGNDTYFVNERGDVLVDAGGVDTAVATEGSFISLDDGIENLLLPTTFILPAPNSVPDIVINGNALDNVIRVEKDLGNFAGMIGGGEGNDTLIGGPGSDDFGGIQYSAYEGDYGNDFVDGGAGFDVLRFGSDSPALVDFGTGTASGGGTSGTVTFTGIEWAVGGDQDDLLRAGDIGVSLSGWRGNDTLIGGDGDDRLSGSGFLGLLGEHYSIDDGSDQLSGGAGNDTLIAGPGSDTLSGGLGNDSLDGQGEEGDPGIDTFLFDVAAGASNADRIRDFVSDSDKLVLDGAVHASSGPSGNFSAGDARFWSSTSGTAHDADDRVIYNTGNGQLWYDADGTGSSAAQLIATLQTGIATPTSLAATDIAIINGSGGGGGGSVINGTSGNDTLTGTAGDDTINGLGGNDLFLAGSTGGADVINGGDGRDSIEFKSAATGAIVVDFGAGTITGGSAGGSISFTSIERVVTGNFDDSLTGNAAAQNLTGQGGADTLAGAGGVDTLWGGGGNDVFIFREMGAANADRISDWTSGADKMQLDDSAFSAIGALGTFAAGDGRFWSAAGATSGHDVNDRVIYNSSTGSLYYDADGSGSGASQLIATVQGAPVVAATDIAVI